MAYLRNSDATVLCGLLTAFSIFGSGTSAAGATYIYDHSINLPFLNFRYDDRKVHFQSAPAAMIEAQFAGGSYGFRAADGREYSKALDLNGYPFWIYAEYRDPKSKCQYDLIDGLRPDPVKPLPSAGGIPVGPDPATTAVVRNCGSGVKLVSREGYDGGLFGGPPDVVFVMEGQRPTDDLGAIRTGLMRDYVQRLLRAFGGKAGLQARLDDARRHGVIGPLAAALSAAELHTP